MVSIDLKDAYLQIPIHPDARKYLRFMAFDKVYQFKVLCFGLSTAQQVFTRVMAPVSAILHSLGIRLRRYLDDWLIQASSREQVLLSLRTVLRLCNSLGIAVNWEKSQLVSTQRICYLGVLLDSVSFRASPAQKRVYKLLSIGDVFLSSVEQPAKSWLELLGVLSSLTQLIPGGRLRMRSFQFVLHRYWDRVDPEALVRWSPEIQQDLLWWLNRDRLELGISLVQVSPQLDLWSDASDVGWGAHLSGQVVSGLWSHEEIHSSINQRELLAIFYALQHFLPLVRNTSVAVFADNTTALAYLKNQGGTRSAVLNQTAQDLLRWGELHSVSLLPQFIMGCNNVLADACVSPKSSSGLGMDVETTCVPSTSEAMAGVNRSICNISQSPLHTISFSLPRSQFDRDRCSSPTVEWVAGVCLSSLCSDSSGSKEAPLVLWGSADDHSSLLAPEAMVSGAPGVSGGRASGSASGQGSVEPASLSSTTSGSVKASSSCLETIQRFVKSCGFSRHVAKQAALARKPSSRAGYQSKWLVYWRWCTSEGHSISRPSLPKIADFLFGLRRSKKLSVSAIMGYRSMLSAVFRSVLPEISTSAVLHDLLRSFRVETPIRSVTPPAWNLLTVLEFLKSPIFEPLRQASLRDLTRKTLFLIALASAKRVSELQALSRTVSFSSSGAAVAYVPEFLAKTESALRPLPRSFDIPSLSDFAAGLPEEMLLCPVRSLSEYVARTSRFADRPRRLFVSPRNPSRAMSKNGISFLLREVIVHSGASPNDVAAPKAHSIRAIATSSAFFRNWSLGSVLEAASWRSNTVFTSFYLKDVQYIMDNVHSLGPFVAAGARLA